MTAVVIDEWVGVCPVTKLQPERGVAALVGDDQVAIFLVGDDVFAVSNLDPFSGANVMSRGLVGTRGDVEGGLFPPTRRFNLSMACNHCLEPTCLSGCPTNAYIKLDNGVVKHNADDCVGCQYCIWNCPYEVPVFNKERRIVTKCDMCLPRLEVGELPACVLA